MEHQQFVQNVHPDLEFKMEIVLTVVINHKIVWLAQIKIVLNAIRDTFYKKMDLVKLVIKHWIIVWNVKTIISVNNAIPELLKLIILTNVLSVILKADGYKAQIKLVNVKIY